MRPIETRVSTPRNRFCVNQVSHIRAKAKFQKVMNMIEIAIMSSKETVVTGNQQPRVRRTEIITIHWYVTIVYWREIIWSLLMDLEHGMVPGWNEQLSLQLLAKDDQRVLVGAHEPDGQARVNLQYGHLRPFRAMVRFVVWHLLHGFQRNDRLRFVWIEIDQFVADLANEPQSVTRSAADDSHALRYLKDILGTGNRLSVAVVIGPANLEGSDVTFVEFVEPESDGNY